MSVSFCSVVTGHGFFGSLHRWAWRQDENFTTELLAAVLRAALSHEPSLALRLINWISSGQVVWSEPDLGRIEIRTQSWSLESIPDLRIATTNKCVLLECKIECPVSRAQLENHLAGLAAEHATEKGLVLLTRDAAPLDEVPSGISKRRWHDLARTMAAECVADPAMDWIVREAVQFLREHGMAIDQVDSSLVSGLTALQRLLLMAEQVMTDLHLQPKTNRSPREHGCHGEPTESYSPLVGVAVWIKLTQPGVIRIEARHVDRIAWQRIHRGDLDAKNVWSEEVDLQQHNFFERDVHGQLDILRELLHDAYRFAAAVASKSTA